VLEQLWQSGSLSAAQVMASMGDQCVTLSTVQSTLERLHRKGIISRSKRGRSFQYAPRVSRSELIGRLLLDMAADLGRGDSALVISGFAEFLATEDPELSARLNEWLDEEERDA
jgi:BlaI family penicillinase repressor